MGTGCLAARQRGRSRTRGAVGRGWGSGCSSSRGSPACGMHGGGREEQISEQTFPAGGITPCCRPSLPRGGHHSAPVHGEYRPCWHPSSRQDRGGPDFTPHTHRPSQMQRRAPAGCCGQRAKLSGCSQAGAEPRCYTGRSWTFSRGARRQPCPLGRQQLGGGVRQHPHQCPPRFSSPTGQAYQLSVPCRSLDTAAAAAALFLLLCALLSPLPGPASSLLLQLQPRDGGKPAATRG